MQNSGNILGACGIHGAGPDAIWGNRPVFKEVTSSKHRHENSLEYENEHGPRIRTYSCVIPSRARYPIPLKLMRYPESWPNWGGVAALPLVSHPVIHVFY